MKHLSNYIKESIDPEDSPKVKRYLKEVDTLCKKLQAEFGEYARIVCGADKGGYEVEIDIQKDPDADTDQMESTFADIFNTTYKKYCEYMDFEPEGIDYTMFWGNAYMDDNTIEMSCIVDLPDYNDMLMNVPCFVALIQASMGLMPLGNNAFKKSYKIIDDFVTKVMKI